MPNWNTRVEQELRSLDRLLSVTLTLESRFGSVEWDLRAAVILGRMRRLYFQDRGSLGFLRRLAAGEPIADKERLRLRALHDSFEAEMEDAAEALRVAARRNGLRIDMDAMALLEGLVNDSTCIRDTIHGMFAAPVGALLDTEASRNDAQFILAELEPRLVRFREAETRLRMRARNHGVELPEPETDPDAFGAAAEADMDDEAREAAEARAAFIGAAPPAPRSGVAGALRSRAAPEPEMRERRHAVDDAHADPAQIALALDLEQPPRRLTRAEAARRRQEIRRLARNPTRKAAAAPAVPAADTPAMAAPVAARIAARDAFHAPASAPLPASAPFPAREATSKPAKVAAAVLAKSTPADPPTPPKRRWFSLRRMLGLEEAEVPHPLRQEPAPLRAKAAAAAPAVAPAPQRREPAARQPASPRAPGSPIRSIS